MVDSSKIEEVFDLAPLVIEGEIVEIKTANLPEVIKTAKPKLDDSDYLRTNLKELAESTKDALDLALQQQADDPNARNTEAVAKIADAVAKVLGNLITLNKVEKDEEHKAAPKQAPIVNNNLTIMTTEEMIGRIINQTKKLKEK